MHVNKNFLYFAVLIGQDVETDTPFWKEHDMIYKCVTSIYNLENKKIANFPLNKKTLKIKQYFQIKILDA